MSTDKMIETIRVWLNSADKSGDLTVFSLIVNQPGHATGLDRDAALAYLIPQLTLRDVEGLISRVGHNCAVADGELAWSGGGFVPSLTETALFRCRMNATRQLGEEALAVVEAAQGRVDRGDVSILRVDPDMVPPARRACEDLIATAVAPLDRAIGGTISGRLLRVRTQVASVRARISEMNDQDWEAETRLEALYTLALSRSSLIRVLIMLGWDGPDELVSWGPGGLCLLDMVKR